MTCINRFKKCTLLVYLVVFYFVFPAPLAVAGCWRDPQATVSKHYLKVGYDRLHNRSLYVCQANLWGSLQIGHTWRGRDRCHLPYANKNYTVDKFSVLSHIEGHWQPYYGFFPKDAWFLGHGIRKENFALCRGYYQRSLVPGKTWDGHGTCDIVFRGKVIALTRYSIFLH